MKKIQSVDELSAGAVRCRMIGFGHHFDPANDEFDVEMTSASGEPIIYTVTRRCTQCGVPKVLEYDGQHYTYSKKPKLDYNAAPAPYLLDKGVELDHDRLGQRLFEETLREVNGSGGTQASKSRAPAGKKNGASPQRRRSRSR